MSYGKRSRPFQPVVCPAGQRTDKQRPYNQPWANDESLEEEHRWREEHIQ